MSDSGDATLYLSYGWQLLPLVPRGKGPHRELLRQLYGDTRIGHLRDAPALIDEVAYWFQYEPEVNLGVFPGNGLVVVDVDHLQALPLEVETPTVVSGRLGGGRHLYFSSPFDLPMTRRAWGHVNPAYAVLPPSVHPSGRLYEWLPSHSPDEVAFMSFDDAAPILGLDDLLP